MQLIEVIRGEATLNQTLVRALDLRQRIRKLLIAAYTGEAMTLIAEGVPAQTIDAADFVAKADDLATRFGGRFAVPDSLRAMAARQGRFHAA